MTGFAELEKKKRVRCFMDGITWQHHLEADSDGAKLYPSKSALVSGSGHSLGARLICYGADECGIVEVEVRLVRWVRPQDLDI